MLGLLVQVHVGPSSKWLVASFGVPIIEVLVLKKFIPASLGRQPSKQDETDGTTSAKQGVGRTLPKNSAHRPRECQKQVLNIQASIGRMKLDGRSFRMLRVSVVTFQNTACHEVVGSRKCIATIQSASA